MSAPGRMGMRNECPPRRAAASLTPAGGTEVRNERGGDLQTNCMSDKASGMTERSEGVTIAGTNGVSAYGQVRWVNSSNAPRWGIDAGQIAGVRKGERLRKQTAAAHRRIKESRASPGVLVTALLFVISLLLVIAV